MFRLPTRVDFEPGCASRIPELIRQMGSVRPLVITDPGVRSTDWFEPLISTCSSCRIEDQVSPNPKAEEVDTIAEVARSRGVDLVVGIGGGSVLDAAKAVAMLLQNPGHINDYEGKDQFRNGSAPFIAVPTTCGTGSEVTWVSVISTPKEGRKISIKGDAMFPRFALSDANLIRTLPPHLIAATGMDAMTHALESLIVRGANPVSDALATRAIFLLMGSLTSCASDPSHAAARGNVMLASTLAGMAFGNADVGAVHCLSESIGGLLDLPHGLLNTLLLSPVLTYQKDAIGPLLSSKLNLPFDNLIERLKQLISALPLPDWTSLNISPIHFYQLAAGAEDNGSNSSNRMALTSSDYRTMLESM
ncbi:MAG: iron-containing alcohol dehydrogenase [Bacteroidetes Order II. Incertae sedis bacterium]|jgi:alcohol dehydrogenase|nr:iron-containing alcohol dehydrogenase [Bacteroidetes Order II. bacterium]